MRLLLACIFLVAAPLTASAQTALSSLNFLRGVWVAEDNGPAAQITEFHWTEIHGDPYLLGRHWAGPAYACPWCVTEAAMAAFIDPTSHEVRLHFRDKEQRTLDFRLLTSRPNYAQFVSFAGLAQPAYLLTVSASRLKLLIKLEVAASGDDRAAFSPLAEWHLHHGY
jgi:hypothetical protein